MASIIQLRNDTKANWEAANPLLAEGEVGIELDTNKMKIGTGTKTWNNLTYTISGGGEGGSGTSSADMELGSVNSQNAMYVDNTMTSDIDIIFTINSSVDEIRKHLNDKCITLSRKKSVNGQRDNYDRDGYNYNSSTIHPVRMNEHRLKTNIRLYCWVANDTVGNSIYDLDNSSNKYFYTLNNADSANDLYNNDPQIYYVAGSTKSGVGTCLNVLTNPGFTVTDICKSSSELHKLQEYDITDIVTWRRNQYWNGQEDTMMYIEDDYFDYKNYFIRMHCHEFKDDEDNRYYFWSNSWKQLVGQEVYACTDPTKVPNDYSDISLTSYNTKTIPYEHVRERQDLRMLRFVESEDYTKADLLDDMINWMNAWGHDYSLEYFGDYPIKPVLLSKCEVKVPVLGPDQETLPLNTYLGWIKVEDVEDWQWEKLNQLDAIEFRLPYSGSYIAMRCWAVNKYWYRNWAGDNRICKNRLKYLPFYDIGAGLLTGTRQKRHFNYSDYKTSEYIFFSLDNIDDVNHKKINKTNLIRKRLVVQASYYDSHVSQEEPDATNIDIKLD